MIPDLQSIVIEEGLELVRFTEEFVRPVFDLIDANRAHLSQLGDETADKYATIQPLYESVMRPINPLRERYVILGSGVVVGSINIEPTGDKATSFVMGYWLGEHFTRQGYASKSARAISDNVLQRPGVSRVNAYTHPDNIPSQKALMNAGFSLLGVVKHGKHYSKRFTKRSSK
ncbi:GNAT family N-acetyltransferase [Candidatus Saccharibacteria bacterium]|nr:GNAT family N-acetyltransferase [Candidatus Saccharibacteria bacterium]